MDKVDTVDSNAPLAKIKFFIKSNDIRILVFGPPLIGFGGFFLWLFIMEQLTHGATSQASFEIGLGVACLIECFAGIAEIYKQEMPGSFGKVIKGKFAVISGIIIVTIFGFSSVFSFISGFMKLFGS